MAVVRKSLEQMRAGRPRIDRAKIDATTEEDIRRHQIEDGQDPDAPLTGFTWNVPARAARQKLNMTQEEFAHAIGVTVSTVNRWENGHIAPSRLARKAMEGLAAEAQLPLETYAASKAN